jgi:hypothetical protein
VFVSNALQTIFDETIPLPIEAPLQGWLPDLGPINAGTSNWPEGYRAGQWDDTRPWIEDRATCQRSLETLACGVCAPDASTYLKVEESTFYVCPTTCDRFWTSCVDVEDARFVNSQTLCESLDNVTLMVAGNPTSFRIVIRDYDCFGGFDGTAVADASFAYGRGLYGGFAEQEQTFYVQAVDGFGNYKRVGGDSFVPSLVGPEPSSTDAPIDIHDFGNGTYSVTFTPASAGFYAIDVTLDGASIGNVPVRVEFVEGTTCPLRGFTQPGAEYASHAADYNPFPTAEPNLGTCCEYTGAACCNNYDLRAYHEDFAQVAVDYAADPECAAAIESLYCGALCSPRQSAIVSEGPEGKRGTLRICESACSAVYSVCGGCPVDGVGLTVASVYGSAKDFCQYLVPSGFAASVEPEPHCFGSSDVSAHPGTTTVAFFDCETTSVTAGDQFVVRITARDVYGNALTLGGEHYTVDVEGPAHVGVSVRDNLNGTYDIIGTTTRSGSYFLTVRDSDDVALNHASPFLLTVWPAAADLSQLRAYGPALAGPIRVNQQTTFLVTAGDRFGNELVLPEADLTLEHTVAASPVGDALIVSQEMLANGTTRFTIVPRTVGNYQVNVAASLADAGNETLDDSVSLPIFFTAVAAIRPDAATPTIDPSRSYAAGPGLTSATVGVGTHFTIFAVDSEGVALTTSAAVAPTVTIRGPPELGAPVYRPAVVDNADGTYTVKYIITTGFGAYVIEILGGSQTIAATAVVGPSTGRRISPSPAVVYATEATGAEAACAFSPTHSFATGVSGTSVGKLTEFTIHAVDVSSKPMTSGGLTWNVVVSYIGDYPSSVVASVVDNLDGTYTVQYAVPLYAGDYEVTAEAIGAGPISLSSEPAGDDVEVPATIISVAANEIGDGAFNLEYTTVASYDPSGNAPFDFMRYASVGALSQVRIVTADRYAVPLTHGGVPFIAFFSGRELDVVDNGDGTYDIAWIPRTSDSRTADFVIRIDDEARPAVPPTPTSVAVGVAGSNILDLEQSTAEGDGLAVAVAGESASFVVTLNDVNGAGVRSEHMVSAVIRGDGLGGGYLTAPVKQASTFSYQVVYVLTVPAEDYTITVYVDGTEFFTTPLVVLPRDSSKADVEEALADNPELSTSLPSVTATSGPSALAVMAQQARVDAAGAQLREAAVLASGRTGQAVSHASLSATETLTVAASGTMSPVSRVPGATGFLMGVPKVPMHLSHASTPSERVLQLDGETPVIGGHYTLSSGDVALPLFVSPAPGVGDLDLAASLVTLGISAGSEAHALTPFPVFVVLRDTAGFPLDLSTMTFHASDLVIRVYQDGVALPGVEHSLIAADDVLFLQLLLAEGSYRVAVEHTPSGRLVGGAPVAVAVAAAPRMQSRSALSAGTTTISTPSTAVTGETFTVGVELKTASAALLDSSVVAPLSLVVGGMEVAEPCAVSLDFGTRRASVACGKAGRYTVALKLGETVLVTKSLLVGSGIASADVAVIEAAATPTAEEQTVSLVDGSFPVASVLPLRVSLADASGAAYPCDALADNTLLLHVYADAAKTSSELFSVRLACGSADADALLPLWSQVLSAGSSPAFRVSLAGAFLTDRQTFGLVARAEDESTFAAVPSLASARATISLPEALEVPQGAAFVTSVSLEAPEQMLPGWFAAVSVDASVRGPDGRVSARAAPHVVARSLCGDAAVRSLCLSVGPSHVSSEAVGDWMISMDDKDVARFAVVAAVRAAGAVETTSQWVPTKNVANTWTAKVAPGETFSMSFVADSCDVFKGKEFSLLGAGGMTVAGSVVSSGSSSVRAGKCVAEVEYVVPVAHGFSATAMHPLALCSVWVPAANTVMPASSLAFTVATPVVVCTPPHVMREANVISATHSTVSIIEHAASSLETSLEVGSEARVVVQLRDAFGEPLTQAALTALRLDVLVVELGETGRRVTKVVRLTAQSNPEYTSMVLETNAFVLSQPGHVGVTVVPRAAVVDSVVAKSLYSLTPRALSPVAGSERFCPYFFRARSNGFVESGGPGVTNSFFLQAIDCDGQETSEPIAIGSVDAISVSVIPVGATPEEASVFLGISNVESSLDLEWGAVELAAGVYRIDYSVNAVGYFRLRVAMDGVDVANAPGLIVAQLADDEACPGVVPVYGGEDGAETHCNARGVCTGELTCVCGGGWSGDDCSTPPAPVLMGVELSPSMSSVSFVLSVDDVDTEAAGTDCAKLLAPATFTLLGEPYRCAWASGSTDELFVVVGPLESPLVIGDTQLAIAGGLTRVSGGPASVEESAVLRVSAGTVVAGLKPTILVSGPRFISECVVENGESLTWSVASSAGFGSEDPADTTAWIWRISPGMTGIPPVPQPVLDEVEAAAGSTELVLSAAALGSISEGFQYRVSVSGENAFGVAGTASFNIQREPGRVSQVSIEKSRVNPVFTGDGVLLFASVRLYSETCEPLELSEETTVSYQWSSPTIIPVDASLTRSPAFFIPAGRMGPGEEHEIRVTATPVVEGVSLAPGSDTIRLVGLDALSASLRVVPGASLRYLAADETISLLAAAAGSDATVEWSCFARHDSERPCYPLERQDGFVTPEGGIEVPTGMLEPGFTYTFCATSCVAGSDASRACVTDSTSIFVDAGAVLPVWIEASAAVEAGGVVDPHRSFLLTGVHAGESTASATWSVTPALEDGDMTILNSSSGALLARVESGALSPGQTYSFTYAVVGADNVSGLARLNVRANDGPVGGSCEVTFEPNEDLPGDSVADLQVAAFADELDIACAGFVDAPNAVPLRYIFAIRQKNWDTVSPSDVAVKAVAARYPLLLVPSAIDEDELRDVVLPPGEEMELVVYVVDGEGGSTPFPIATVDVENLGDSARAGALERLEFLFAYAQGSQSPVALSSVQLLNVLALGSDDASTIEEDVAAFQDELEDRVLGEMRTTPLLQYYAASWIINSIATRAASRPFTAAEIASYTSLLTDIFGDVGAVSVAPSESYAMRHAPREAALEATSMVLRSLTRAVGEVEIDESMQMLDGAGEGAGEGDEADADADADAPVEIGDEDRESLEESLSTLKEVVVAVARAACADAILNGPEESVTSSGVRVSAWRRTSEQLGGRYASSLNSNLFVDLPEGGDLVDAAQVCVVMIEYVFSSQVRAQPTVFAETSPFVSSPQVDFTLYEYDESETGEGQVEARALTPSAPLAVQDTLASVGGEIMLGMPQVAGSPNREMLCVWYNEESRSWSEEGCRVAQQESEEEEDVFPFRIVCACTHLTLFATSVGAPLDSAIGVGPIVVGPELSQFPEVAPFSVDWALFAAALILLLLLLCCLCIVWYLKRLSMRVDYFKGAGDGDEEADAARKFGDFFSEEEPEDVSLQLRRPRIEISESVPSVSSATSSELAGFGSHFTSSGSSTSELGRTGSGDTSSSGSSVSELGAADRSSGVSSSGSASSELGRSSASSSGIVSTSSEYTSSNSR